MWAVRRDEMLDVYGCGCDGVRVGCDSAFAWVGVNEHRVWGRMHF